MTQTTILKSAYVILNQICDAIATALKNQGKDISANIIKRLLISKHGQPLLDASGQKVFIKTNAPLSFMESRKDLLTVFYSRADDGGDFYSVSRDPAEYTIEESMVDFPFIILSVSQPAMLL